MNQEVRVRYALQAVVFLVSSIVLLPVAARAQANPDWHRAIPGFKIAGNLYYVGTADLAAYLIATPQGNILINGNFKQDVPAIRTSIEGLGFKYADTKILLISHAHGDHDEGIGLIKSDTGARLMVMDADVAAWRAQRQDGQVRKSIVSCTTETQSISAAPHSQRGSRRDTRRLHDLDDAGGRG